MEWLNGIQLDSLLSRIVALLVAITLHDAAQAAAASLLGDRTAREQGRMTLNPLAHLSAIGLLPILFGPFGWSKPVPVAPSGQLRRPWHAVAIYASGPAVNLIVAVLLWGIELHLPGAISGGLFHSVLQWFIIVNMMLVLLHLLPFYPMDLWKIIRRGLPQAWEPKLNRQERLGTAVLIALIVTPFGQVLFMKGFNVLGNVVMQLYGAG
ncbi:site-2 protease family protein [Paenibacillus koleovorans]|uniref:site-2 protease family protein n=1 Tax=Paenibacillus koleovorans TaxID=121608 RepID=UPI000FDA1B84|nr:site-2 protease family protein [Paenibacillus koleovorans]